MMQHGYSYAATLAASQKVQWQVEDIIGAQSRLDFTRPFLPESLARVESLDFLQPGEKLLLNQIRGHNYLYLFGLVEEFILPFLLDHLRAGPARDDARIRALLGFAAEEAKHIDLFKRFRRLFQQGFGTDCAVIGPAEAVAEHVLSHKPLAVALAILHIEWMTQRHYLESVRDDGGLDPCFRDLLKYHWMEEAQHARLDTLIVEELAQKAGVAETEAAIDGYLSILEFLDGGLAQQVAFDIASFEKAAGRCLEAEARSRLHDVQRAAMRWTFLVSGMTHDAFRRIVGHLSPAGARRIEAQAARYA
jgi:hypothetical protein